ncbi:hypothetical protein HRW07_03710, partial [Streptomyces lunaelactis]|uniref:hypothetical protein n=1 Tax=Streptomyces lunaelactis TaxID=1535768 RepID=UPI001584B286
GGEAALGDLAAADDDDAAAGETEAYGVGGVVVVLGTLVLDMLSSHGGAALLVRRVRSGPLRRWSRP